MKKSPQKPKKYIIQKQKHNIASNMRQEVHIKISYSENEMIC